MAIETNPKRTSDTESGRKCSHADYYVTRTHPSDGEPKPYCRTCREFLEL